VVCTALVAALLSGCGDDDTVKVHVTIWDGAVIMDSVTLAVVGWEYDQELPGGSWDNTKYSNINQYLYKYHFQDSSLEYVATLARDAGFYATYPGVLYSAPWVVYATHDGGSAIGMYNVTTHEHRVALTLPVDASLEALSPGAKYLAYRYGIDMTREISDMATGAVADTVPQDINVFYLDDTLGALGCRSCGFSSCTTYVGRYWPGQSRFEVAGVLPHRARVTTSDKSCFVAQLQGYAVGAGSVPLLLLDSLKIDALPGLSRACDDLDKNEGTYVELRGRSLYVGNYAAGVSAFALLSEGQQEIGQ